MTTRFLLALAILFSCPANADSWGPPTPVVVSSPDTKIIVRIEPGGSTKAVGKFARLTRSDSARAAFFRFEETPESYSRYLDVPLSNPVKPIDAYVNNSGVLVTLDNYGNPGYGDILSIYNQRGELVRTYKIEEIYTDNAISEMERTRSTQQWRHPEYRPRFSKGDFVIADVFGNYIFVKADNGSLLINGEKLDYVQKQFQWNSD